VLVMKRSILTEKISRRGFHLSREYAIDPLEILFARDVMRPSVVFLSTDAGLEELSRLVRSADHSQRLFPLIDKNGKLSGVLSRRDFPKLEDHTLTISEVTQRKVVMAFSDEPLRLIVYRMAETGRTRMPVVDRENPRQVLGMISLADLLRARTRDLEQERRRERILRLRLPFGLAEVGK